MILPIVERMVKMGLRTVTIDVPSRECVARDNVTVKGNAVTYFCVVNPEDAVVQVIDNVRATSRIAQTTFSQRLGRDP
jgi:regulator of protease activity HflC (stomatin/prohibitin superfamily)